MGEWMGMLIMFIVTPLLCACMLGIGYVYLHLVTIALTAKKPSVFLNDPDTYKYLLGRYFTKMLKKVVLIMYILLILMLLFRAVWYLVFGWVVQ